MYVTLRRYADKGALIGGLAPLVREGFVPLLRRAPGFRGYCAFASDDGDIISVTIFENRQTAEQSDDRVREWVVSNLRDLLPNPPEVTAGEVLLHEVAKLQNDDPAMFITVREYAGIGPKEEVLPQVQEHVFLMITGAGGFRGYYALYDEGDNTRAVAVSLFDTSEHAMEASQRVVATMGERHIAPHPPRVSAGWVAVAATAARSG